MRYQVSVDGETFQIVIARNGQVWVNGRTHDVDFRGEGDQMRYSLLIDSYSYEVHVERVERGECSITVGGRTYRASLQPWGQQARRAPLGSTEPDIGQLRAPLPGVLVGVPVRLGQRVAAGQVVVILESMKMNLELRAPMSGVVEALHGDLGAQVSQGEVLATVRPEEED